MSIFGRKSAKPAKRDNAMDSKDAFKRSPPNPVKTSRGTAFIRVMSGTERDAWMRIYRAEQEKAKESPCELVYCPLLVRTLTDGQGNRIYTDDDVATLAAETDSNLLHQLFELALEINKLGNDAVDDEKKDCGQNRSSNSGSASQSDLE